MKEYNFWYSERQKEIIERTKGCNKRDTFVNGVEYTEMKEVNEGGSNFKDAILVFTGSNFNTTFK